MFKLLASADAATTPRIASLALLLLLLVPAVAAGAAAAPAAQCTCSIAPLLLTEMSATPAHVHTPSKSPQQAMSRHV
jgi:hypothetical protein